jgi:hypothetical protein
MIEYLPLVLTGVGIIVSILYYTSVLRNANRTRQAQLFMDLYRTYRDPIFRKQYNDILHQKWSDFDDFWEKYGQKGDPDAWTDWQTVASYFNGIGVLLRQGLLNIEVIYELLAPTVFMAWMMMGPVAEGFKELSAKDSHRALYNDLEGVGRPKNWEPWSGFKYLNDELKKKEEQMNR